MAPRRVLASFNLLQDAAPAARADAAANATIILNRRDMGHSK